MRLIYAQDAMFRALTEEGPYSLAYRICEYAYGSGEQMVDYDGLLADIREGCAKEPPALRHYSATDLKAVFDRLIDALGNGLDRKAVF